MASIRQDKGSNGKPNGRRTLQVVCPDGTRRGIRLGKITARDADIVADLSKPEGRTQAIEAALAATSNEIDCVVLSAGLSGVKACAKGLVPASSIAAKSYGPVAPVTG